MRGDGRIFKPKASSLFHISYCLRGKEYRETSGTSDEKQAQKFLRARLREVAADIIGARVFTTPKASKLTVAELAEALKADFELRGKASPQNLSYFKRVSADFGDYCATALTAEKIDAYIERRLAEGSAKASINRVTQLLGQCFVLAIRRGHLNRAPYIRHLSEKGNERQDFFSEQEFDGVLAHLPDDLKDFARFAYVTGMRSGEIKSLTWTNVQGDVLTLRGENAKNGEARSVPLIGSLAGILERRKAARQVKVNGVLQMSEFFFHRNGRQVGEFRKAWQTACLAAGVAQMVCSLCGSCGVEKRCPTCKKARKYSGKIFHSFRRSACRNLSQAGVPQQVAMRISGHKTDSMFRRYNIVVTDDLRTALERTEQYRATAAQQKVVSMR